MLKSPLEMMNLKIMVFMRNYSQEFVNYFTYLVKENIRLLLYLYKIFKKP